MKIKKKKKPFQFDWQEKGVKDRTMGYTHWSGWQTKWIQARGLRKNVHKVGRIRKKFR